MPGLSAAATKELTRLYQVAADDVNKAAGRAILQIEAARAAGAGGRRSSEFTLLRSAGLQGALAERLALLNVQVDRTLTPALVESLTKEITKTDRQTAELLGTGEFGSGQIERLAQDTANVAAREMAARMGAAAASHADNAVRLVRALGPSNATATNAAQLASERAVNTAIARGLIAGDPRLIEREVRQALGAGLVTDAQALSYRKLGNQQVQVGGWTGSLRAYASTVARTRSAEVANDAAFERMREAGINLATIEGNITANFCTAFVGLVVGLDGPVTFNGRTYPAASSLPEGGAPFHPNCSKGYAPFDFELSSSERVALAAKRLEVFEARRDAGTLRERVRA
jgi:hypothetical protein